MGALNKRASEIMVEAGASTATDITGFGLIGHMWEVLNASNLLAHLYAGRVPYFRDALAFADKNVVPGGTIANLQMFGRYVEFAEGIADAEKVLLNDAQTSGGLLIFIPPERKDALVTALEAEGILAAHIGDAAGGEAEGGRRVIVGS